MSDPVDTDALRALSTIQWSRLMDWASEAEQGLIAAADEVDRLRTESAAWSAQAIETAEVLGKTGIEVGRLRAVIENAPHEEDCPAEYGCTCWKVGAL